LPADAEPWLVASPHFDVHRRGGIAATFELLRDGHTSHRLTAAVRSGEVIRVRQGHYACPELAAEELAAYRVGGRLTGLSGARRHGLWTPRSGVLEVLVKAGARALRTPHDPRLRLVEAPGAAQVRWRDHGVTGTRTLANAVECIRDVVRTQPTIVAFAVIESALHRGVVTKGQQRALLRGRPGDLLQRASRLSESGGESLLAFHLLALGLDFRQQVNVNGVGRVDFLVGDRLVIEVDGAQFHTGPAFENDRRRDAALSALGFRVLRFSYTQVERRPGEVVAAILAARARGDFW
jgi:very-short-patch-repair endonuclease